MNVNHFIKDKLLIFEITEEIDHHVVERLRKRIDYEIQRIIPRKVVLDFNKVNFMDSAGIGFVLGRYKIINNFGGVLELKNVNNKLKRIFEMSGIHKIISIIDDCESKKIS